MGNPISEQLTRGTIGELIVQLRLLQCDVQAAPPLKDSGNDLVALKKAVIKTIQVKTTGTINVPRWPGKRKQYDILALVHLRGEGRDIRVDQTDVFLIPKEALSDVDRDWDSLGRFLLTEEYVSYLFSEQDERA